MQSPEFSFTYEPSEIPVPDSYADFLDIEYSLRRRAYDNLRFAVKSLKKFQSKDQDQYHSTYVNGGQRKVLIARWKYDKHDYWQVVVNDEVTNDTLGRSILARDYTFPASVNHIHMQSSSLSRGQSEHVWTLPDDCAPLIFPKDVDEIMLSKGKRYVPLYEFSHEDKGMIEVLKRRENAEELNLILTGLSKTTHEPGFSHIRRLRRLRQD